MRSRLNVKMPTLTGLISLCLVLNLFLLRPTALGEKWTPLGMMLAIPLVGLHMLHTSRKKAFSNPMLRREMTVLFCLLAAYWLYVGPISIGFNRSELVWTMKELWTTLVIVLAYGAFLLDEQANRLFFRKLCTIVGLLGLSSVITVALSYLLGSRLPLYLFTIAIKGYTEENADLTAATGAVYFPFSMLYTDFVSGSVKLDRYCAFFREAGIYQAVACFCLAYEAFTRRSKIVMFGLVGGTICAFSSLGVTLLVLTLGTIHLFSRARIKPASVFITAVLVGVSYPAALYTPYIGLADKAVTHGTSLSDREASIHRALETVQHNPFGYGLFTGKEDNDGICLLAQLGMIGLFGFSCQVLIMSGFRPGQARNWRKVAACAPLVITALVSQPIAGAPMSYVIVMAFIPAASRRAAGLRTYAHSHAPQPSYHPAYGPVQEPVPPPVGSMERLTT
jgi:hypothetical protein